MQKRYIEKLGITLSTFGVGCMRYPMKEENGKKVIDEEQSIQMIRTAIDNGVNYMDTAYVYFDGESEKVLGKALLDGYREKTYVATKLPTWHCNTYEDFEKSFNIQLERLQTDWIDFYLVHSLNKDSWKKAKDLGVCKFLDELKASGKIKYACFSFHDSYDVFEDIINSYDWDMCQIQFNFMDINNQAGEKGLKLAGEKKIPVVIMEGLLGGRLAKAPENVQALYDAFPIKRTPVEWAFRWIANYKEVAVILSGVSNMEQTLDNIRIFDEVGIDIMSEDELALINKVREAYQSRTKVNCTACKYCMPCPKGVNIPRVFAVWNNAYQYSQNIAGNWTYKKMIDEKTSAQECINCRKCVKVCPQKIDIPMMLKQADIELK